MDPPLNGDYFTEVTAKPIVTPSNVVYEHFSLMKELDDIPVGNPNVMMNVSTMASKPETIISLLDDMDGKNFKSMLSEKGFDMEKQQELISTLIE